MSVRHRTEEPFDMLTMAARVAQYYCRDIWEKAMVDLDVQLDVISGELEFIVDWFPGQDYPEECGLQDEEPGWTFHFTDTASARLLIDIKPPQTPLRDWVIGPPPVFE